jgi:hypothetical protein
MKRLKYIRIKKTYPCLMGVGDSGRFCVSSRGSLGLDAIGAGSVLTTSSAMYTTADIVLKV